MKCRVTRGDGEDTEALCIRVKPDAIFLDWDRTFCTTRGGASPLYGNHSADEALLSLALTHPRLHIITRNPHSDAIKVFMQKHGCVSPSVRSVKREGITKAEAILDLLAPGEVGVFADDDPREIFATEMGSLAKEGRLHRVLFVRGL